jgi:hypothetical protein
MAAVTRTKPDNPDNPGHVRPCLAGQTGHHPLGLSGSAGDWPEETWILVRVLPDPDGVPASVRFRRLLKAMRRAYGLAAVRVTGQVPDVETVKTDDAADAS